MRTRGRTLSIEQVIEARLAGVGPGRTRIALLRPVPPEIFQASGPSPHAPVQRSNRESAAALRAKDTGVKDTPADAHEYDIVGLNRH